MSAAAAPPPIVSLRGLSKRFAVRRTWGQILRRPTARSHVAALDGVTLDVRPGELFGLLGPNGAGKTTLFKILATLVLPDGGSARVTEYDVASQPSRVRGVLTPVIADERSLFWRLSAFENVRLFAGLYGLGGAQARQRTEELLAVVGLSDAGEKLAGAFSSGMKQRLLIARALISKPRVLLLDEPTRSLDPVSARDFRRFLRDEVGGRQGCTILLATHNAEEALTLCDRVGVLHRGRLLAVGGVDELAGRLPERRYRLVARAEAEGCLAQLASQGLVRGVARAAGDEEGWPSFDLEIAGGGEEASQVLARVVGAGVGVARFERLGTSLADLLERIVAGAADA